MNIPFGEHVSRRADRCAVIGKHDSRAGELLSAEQVALATPPTYILGASLN
jgi:hypothetical protein